MSVCVCVCACVCMLLHSDVVAVTVHNKAHRVGNLNAQTCVCVCLYVCARMRLCVLEQFI